MIHPNDLAVDDEDMDLILWESSNQSWFQLVDEDSKLGEPDNIPYINQKRSLQEIFDAETSLHFLTEENTCSMQVMGEKSNWRHFMNHWRSLNGKMDFCKL